ncbi:retrovirus-related Pol polyprotein from transposon 297 [Trichonephila clavipes]|nr:retrovirus-related Pol polyprotein from transposon 297 [Trichonephila clavipes]
MFSNNPGLTNLVEHEIQLVSDQPVRTKPYRMSHRQNEILKNEINRMLKLGIIEVGESDYMSPVILVEIAGERTSSMYSGLLPKIYKSVLGNCCSVDGCVEGKSKEGEIKWTTECENAFRELKGKLIDKPVLYAPNFEREFIVQTDASNAGMGAVLTVTEQGEEHPIVYLIMTDHNPLVWLNRNVSSNPRLMRWALALQPYNFRIVHRSAKVEEKQFETLNKETATHIGIRDAEDWFRPIDLAKECDIYISSKNGSRKEIPIACGYTQDTFKNRSRNYKPEIKDNYPQYLETENKNCYICGDSSHYARDCEKRFKPKESHIHNRINVNTLKVESEKQNSDEFANLQYVNIFVENQPVTALIDSG